MKFVKGIRKKVVIPDMCYLCRNQVSAICCKCSTDYGKNIIIINKTILKQCQNGEWICHKCQSTIKYIDLKTHQHPALHWMLDVESQGFNGGLLADSMGLGKTIVTLGLINNNLVPDDDRVRSVTKTLIMLPPSLYNQWIQEIRECLTCLNDDQIIFYYGPRHQRSQELKRKKNKAIIAISTYNILRNEIATDRKLAKDKNTAIRREMRKIKQQYPHYTKQQLRHQAKQQYTLTRTYGLKLGSIANPVTTLPIKVKKYKNNKDKNAEFLINWDYDRIICDEVHLLSNITSKSFLEILPYIDKATFRWLLTGTPFNNHITEFAGLGRILGIMPFNEIKFWRKVLRIETQLELGRSLNELNESELEIIAKFREMKQTHILQRLKLDAPQLQIPPKQIKIIKCSMTTNQMIYYKKTLNSCPWTALTNPNQKINVRQILTKINVLRQITISALQPGLIKETKYGHDDLGLPDSITSEMILENSGKMSQFLKILQTIPKNQKILIFSAWIATLRQVARILESIGYVLYRDFVFMIGCHILRKPKDKIIHDFNQKEGPQIMLCTLKAGI